MIYYWSLAVVVASATDLSVVLGRELSPILSLCGCKRLGCHFASMGLSYTLMLSAFYVDNGKRVLPVAVGATIIIYVMLRHPLMRRTVAG